MCYLTYKKVEEGNYRNKFSNTIWLVHMYFEISKDAPPTTLLSNIGKQCVALFPICPFMWAPLKTQKVSRPVEHFLRKMNTSTVPELKLT